MTGCSRVPPVLDDSALPDDERAMLEARAGADPGPRRAPPARLRATAAAGRDDRRVPCGRHPAHSSAAALRRDAGPVQPVLADRRGIDLWLRVGGLGLRR